MNTTVTWEPCPGSGRKWTGGTGLPICPTCHRGPIALFGMTQKQKRAVRKGRDVVPAHERRVVVQMFNSIGVPLPIVETD